MKKILLLTAVFFCFKIISHAQPGEIDSSFGTNGIVRADLGERVENVHVYGRQVLLLPDRSIYIICAIENKTVIGKRLPNGTADASYGIDGFSSLVSIRDARGAIQPDGKIVVAGKVGESEAGLARFNTDGSLDNSFSEDGKLIIASDYNNSEFYHTNSVAIQNDGKIVVSGTAATGPFTGYNADFALTRYNADGTLDKTFSNDGKQTTDFGPRDIASCVAIQSDGKILIGGSARGSVNSNSNFALARYNTDGSLDNSFSEDGKQTTDFNPSDGEKSYDNAYALTIQEDGKILLAGSALYGLAIARYNTDGSLDNTFSNDGKQVTNTDRITNIGGSFSEALSITLQNDAKIVVAGYTNETDSYQNNDFVLARYTTDGSLDNTFSNDGIETIDFGKNDHAFSAAVQNDGKVLVTGRISTFDSQRVGFARYNANGSLDTEFNNGKSIVSIFPHGNTHFTKTAIQSDGKIVAAGYTWNGSSFVSILTRYNTNGSVDTAFNKNGILITGGGDRFGFPASILSIVIQSDGKIVVVIPEYQEDQYSTALVRYNADGSLDHTFNGNGKVTSSLRVRSIAIQNDGKIVAAGSKSVEVEESDGLSYVYFAVARYNTDGSLDKTFSDDGIQTTDLGKENNDYVNSDGASSVLIQKDGKIVGVGYTSSLEHSEIAIARYNTDGSLDSSFSEDGMQTFAVSEYLDDVSSAALQSDGKIAVAGGARVNDENSALYVALFNTDGSLYSVFEGFNSTDYYNYSIANSIAIQTDDKIFISGEYKGRSVLARLKKDGTLDSTFSNLGEKTIEEYIINDIAISGNKFYTIGYDTDNLGVVARYFLEDNENTNNPPTVSLAIPNNIVKYTFPARIKLNATATDKDGKITKVQFYNGSTLLHTEDVAPYGFLWVDVYEGNYTLTAKAFDNSGHVTTSNVIDVSVVDYNVPPVVRIVSPVRDTTYTGPATIRLAADAKDPNDRISKVEFYIFNTATQRDSLLRTEYYYPYTYTWANVQPGYYNISAKAYDDKGLSATTYSAVTVAAPMASRPSSVKQNDLKDALSLTLSPNPARSTLQISTKGLQLDKPSLISVISSSGVVMKTVRANNASQLLDVSFLASGVYTVKVVNGDKILYKRFVKL